MTIGIASLTGIEAVSSGGFTGVRIEGTSDGDSFDFSGVSLSGIVSINGGDGNDTIVGSGIADTIIGGLGGDTLRGGLGADIFAYGSVGESTNAARDALLDFSRAEGDRIDLRAIDAIVGRGDNSFAWGGTTATANGVWYSTDGTNATVFADTDGNAATAELVIYLSDTISLQPTDFFL